MKKKITVAIVSLIAVITVGGACLGVGLDAYADSLYAAGAVSFPSISNTQYMKLQLDTNDIYTALDTTGKFLSDQSSVTDPVEHTTTTPAKVDARNANFITSTKIPSYTDLQPVISANTLHAHIPTTGTWWLSDTSLVNTLNSARVVDSNNKVNEETYAAKSSTGKKIKIWNGYYPLENKTFPKEKISTLYSSSDTYAPFNNITSGKIEAYGTGKNWSSIYYLCDAIYENGVLLPCDPVTNPSIAHDWYGGKGYALQKVVLDPVTKYMDVIGINEPDGRNLHQGDLVIVGELRWPIGVQNGVSESVSTGYPQTGYGFKVVGADTTITDTATNNWGGNINQAYFMGETYEDVKVEKQKAYVRPLITIDTSEIAYIHEQGQAITDNSFTPLVTNAQAGKNYIAHVKDHNLKLNGIGTITNSEVVYDSSTNTIYIPKGTQTISLPVNMSAINNGYIRSISALGTNTTGQTVFGQIGSIQSGTSVTFDVGAFVNIHTIGSQNTITLFAEDIQVDKTSYISDGFQVNLEVYGELEISYTSRYGNSLTYYNSGINVKTQDKIGELSYLNGIPSRKFEIIQDPLYPTDTSYQNFALENLDINGVEKAGTTSPLNVTVKQNVSAILAKTAGLKPDVYHFGIKAVDKNGNPVDQSGAPTAVLYETLVVYPHDTQITYTQHKNGSDYYTLNDINANNYDLGTIVFDNDANIKKLNEQGYTIKNVQLVTKGTSTPLTMLEAILDTGDSTLSTYILKKKGTMTSGDKEFDILITFENGSHETAQIRKENQKLIIPEALAFVDQKTSSFLTSDTYEVIYDPVIASNNSYFLWATDSDHATVKNNDVKYCVLDSATNDCDTSAAKDTVIQVQPSTGQMNFVAQGPGTHTASVKLRAYIKDADGTYLSKKDITVNVNPATQKLEWAGTDIQTAGNTIVKGASSDSIDHHPTWKLELKYDNVIPSNNIYSYAEYYEAQSSAAGTIGLCTNVNGSNGTPPLQVEYTLELSPADTGKITLDTTNKTITVHDALSNDARIKAIAKGTGNYADTINTDDPTTSSVNEDGSATLLIQVSTKPSIIFTPSVDLDNYKVAVTHEIAKGNAPFGNMSIQPAGETITGYEITKVELYNATSSLASGSDVWDTIATSTFKTAGTMKEELWSTGVLLDGRYKITMIAKNGLMEVSNPKTIEIKVEKETFDVTKLKWQKKGKEDTAFSDVAGSIKDSDKTNTKPVETVFIENGTLQVALTEKTAGYLDNATITYDVKDAASSTYLHVDTNGKVTMKKAGTAYIKAHITKNGYEDLDVYVPITIEKGNAEFMFTDCFGDPLMVDGTTLTKDANGIYTPYNLTYEKDKLIDIFTSGAPTGSEVTINIISEVTPTASNSNINDVLKFQDGDTNVSANGDTADKVCTITATDYNSTHLSACQTMIQNALMNKNDVIKLVATSSATDDYDASTITLPIKISKAEQPDFAFKQNEFSVLPDKNGTFTPTFIKKQSTGKIQLSTIPSGGSADLPADKAGIKAGSDEAFVNKKDTIWYNIPLQDGEEPVHFHVYAKDLGDRNYKASPEVSMRITVDPASGSKYDITLESTKPDTTTSQVVTYGDVYFTMDAYSPKDDTELHYQYTYELINDAGAYIEKQAGENNKFRPLKAGENITIKITRINTDTGIVEPSMVYTFNIYKKDIVLSVKDIQKLQGEAILASDYMFTRTPDFAASDVAVIGNAEFSCIRGLADITTLPFTELKDDGLSIKAGFKETDQNKEILKNYNIQITPGTLHVSVEASSDTWYEIVPGENAGITTSLGVEGWYNGPVDVRLVNSASGIYDRIGSAISLPFDPVKFTVSSEGNHAVDVYFQQSTGVHAGAISTPQIATIKIDTTDPKVDRITGTEVHRDGLKQLIHNLTGGLFFKPGVEVEIDASDCFPGNDESIAISGLKEITYKVYEVDNQGNVSSAIYKQDRISASDKVSFTLPASGKYYVEATATDKAGNESAIFGSFINVKKIDLDEDGDGELDFNDPDGDGCPDLNIVLGNDIDGNPIKLNVAEKGKTYPYMNIDSDGDGKPDLNIDTDGDKRPDLNLVILSEDDWNPKTCVVEDQLKDYTNPNEYCTGTDAKPQINVDIGYDINGNQTPGIPDINIDTDGDMKADFNIDIYGETEGNPPDTEGNPPDGKPDINIGKVHTTWKPDTDYTYEGFAYDTMLQDRPLINVDSDKDGRPDLNLDIDRDGEPDLNIDADGDGIPETNIDSDGDGIADINIDSEGDGIPKENIMEITEWKPAKDCEKDGFLYDTMELRGASELEDNGIKVEKPNGAFLPNSAIKVNDISDSIDKNTKDKIEDIAKEQEIKKVYDVEYLENNITKQPNGKVKVKLPVDSLIKNAKVIAEQADGTFKEISVTEENGYYVYETDYIGKVSIVGDKENTNEPTQPSDPTPVKPSTSVKGNYHSNSTGGIGGAITGDTTTTAFYLLCALLSFYVSIFLLSKHKQKR